MIDTHSLETSRSDSTESLSLLTVKQQRRIERLVVIVLATVQFATIVDFMIVMPLGPQLMRKLNIGPAEFGMIVSSYTFAAGAAGLVASAIADRFGRRLTFLTLFSGFLIGTFCCALATNYVWLVVARVVTGAFGGILGGVAMAIIGDVFPEERRGQATGSLMTGFALASVAGVPLGLVLGTRFGWQVPFIVLAASGIPILLMAQWTLPPLRGPSTLAHVHPLRSLLETFSHPNHLRAFALIITLMLGSFTVFSLSQSLSRKQCWFHRIAVAIRLRCWWTVHAGRIAARRQMGGPLGQVACLSFSRPVICSDDFADHASTAGTDCDRGVVVWWTDGCNVGRMIPAMAMSPAVWSHHAVDHF